MLLNYLKIAVRNLSRNKAFSAINILGMASAMLIVLWIANEVRYERFHAKKDRIYEAWNQTKVNGETSSWNTTPKVLAKNPAAGPPGSGARGSGKWGWRCFV